MARYMVTSALPYANGPLHLGHLAGAYLPADIFVRYLRMNGHDVVYACGTDEHGVPITITAEKLGLTPRETVDRFHGVIRQDFNDFGISFSNFSRTTTDEHREFAQSVFLELLSLGHIEPRTISQLYCPSCARFLPDRYIGGTCPKCGCTGARGDQCEACGTWTEPLELIEPRCSICGATPVIRETRHWFLLLARFQEWITGWLESRQDWKDNVLNYCRGWLKDGLRERAITRDLDWGVPVPLPEASGKVLYVWFEALLGYISSTREYFRLKGEPDGWEPYWKDPDTRLVHFIGKDNIVFHCIIEPAILHGTGGFILPWNVPANEFLNIQGQKFSTSRGTAIWMRDYLNHFPADPMRYALAVNAPETRDTDFTWDEFRSRNNELADVLGNFVNRTVRFTSSKLGGVVPEGEPIPELMDIASRGANQVGELIEKFRFKLAATAAMEVAREGNRFFDARQPWKTLKTDPAGCRRDIAGCLNLCASLQTIFSPFLPKTAERIGAMLGTGQPGWTDAGKTLLKPGAPLGTPEILFTKLDEGFQKVMEPSFEKQPEAVPEPGPMVDFDDFMKIELRVGEVLEVSPVKGADKLYKLMVNLGEGEPRQIVAGIRLHYEPAELLNTLVVVVANLKPAVLRGIESRGMLLASDGPGGVKLVRPSAGATPGDRIR
ncbi:MAG: methionine--tRNA ligase [Candidatus Fermentibacteraceae bacterium]